jgi:hypothetical protein
VTWLLVLWLAQEECEQPLRARLIAWMAEASDAKVCLEVRSGAGIDPSGTIRIPVDAPLGAAAARAAHLAAHRSDGALDPPAADCEEWLAAQQERERAAWAIEVRLLRRYGARPLFREDVLTAYRARCERLTR